VCALVASAMPTGARTSASRRACATALTVLVTLPLAGCSGDTSTPQSAPSTPSTSEPAAAAATSGETPSPVPTVEPPPPAPAPVRGTAGQRAFARHVMDLWGFALRTNDAKPLVALGRGRPCGGCPALQRELARRAAAGWTVDFAGVQVRRTTLSRDGAVVVARAKVDIPESDSYNTDGTYRNTSPAHAGATFEVRMRFSGGRYRLLSFTVA
jgi:hypothetical protein